MKSIFKYMPSVIIPTICTLFITILYGNFLTPDQYGEFNIFITTISILDVIFFSFISLSVIRFYIVYKQGKEVELLITYFISLILILVGLFIISYLIFKENILYVLLGVSGYGLFTFYSNLLRVAEKALVFNIIRIAIPVSTIILLGLNIIIFNKLVLKSVILSVFAPYFITALILTIFYIFNNKIKLIFNKDIFKETISYGVPLIAVGLLNLLLAASDRYMINYYLGSEQVGIYSFGYRIAELSMINITNMVIMGMYPSLIYVFENQGKDSAEKILDKMLDIHYITTIPVILNLILFTKDIVRCVFKNYIGAESIVIYIAFGTFFYAISFYLNKAFELTKNTKKMLFSLILATIFNIILNFILIPIIGIKGAIISTIISYILYIMTAQKLSKKVFKVKINYKKLAMVIGINVVTFIIVYSINILLPKIMMVNVIIGGVSYILIYISIIFILIKKQVLVI